MSKLMDAPDFAPGDVIASDLYMGVVTGAFWDGTWNYIIGENASVPATEDDKADGYRMGHKFIKSDDIRWHLVNFEWKEAL